MGFQTHDQGSTSFSFVQFSRSCCAVSFRWQLVYYTTSNSVCQELFWSFLGFFEGFFNPAKPAQAVVMGFSAAAPRGTAWLYYHRLSYFVNRFFEFFDKFRMEFLGSVYIVVLLMDKHNLWERLRLPQNRTGEQCSPLQSGNLIYCPVGRGDLTPPWRLATTAKQQGGVTAPAGAFRIATAAQRRLLARR